MHNIQRQKAELTNPFIAILYVQLIVILIALMFESKIHFLNQVEWKVISSAQFFECTSAICSWGEQSKCSEGRRGRRSISGEIWSQSGGGGHFHTSTLLHPRITPQAAATHKWPGAPECNWPRDNLCNASASWLHWVALTQWWCTGCQRHHPPIKLFQINCTAPWLHCTELCITITTSAPRDGKRSKNAVRPKIVRSLQPESNNKVEHLVPNLKFVSALK